MAGSKIAFWCFRVGAVIVGAVTGVIAAGLIYKGVTCQCASLGILLAAGVISMIGITTVLAGWWAAEQERPKK